jgi:Tol biopolymer transport system component
MHLYHRTLLGLASILVATTISGGTPELLSRRTSQELSPRSGNRGSTVGFFSQDSAKVVFSSSASDLIENDLNGSDSDVFLQNLATGETILVSADPLNNSTSGQSYGPTISGDGSRIAFFSNAAGLVAGDNNQAHDVFVRDIPAGKTLLVSVNHDGSGSGSQPSLYPVISNDGRWVAFESEASNLTEGSDTNSTGDVFLRDLSTGHTELVSARPGTGEAGNGESQLAANTPNAELIVFRSTATDLATNTAGIPTDLYVWKRSDRSLQRIALPEVATASLQWPVQTANAVLSGDGRFLVFRTELIRRMEALSGLWRFDLETGAGVLVSSGLDVTGGTGGDNASGPSMTPDGRLMAFVAFSTNAPGIVPARVFLWQEGHGLRSLNSLLPSVPDPDLEPTHSEDPTLSADGTRLAFVSTNAMPALGVITEGAYRLYVRTLATGATFAVPLAATNRSHELALATFSEDATKLLFQTEAAGNLAADENNEFDVFVADVPTTNVTQVSLADPLASSATPNGASTLVSTGLSDSGRFLLFHSAAANLPTSLPASPRGFYRLDRQTGTVIPAIPTGAANLPASIATVLQFSFDGQRILFSSPTLGLTDDDTNSLQDVFVRNLETGTTTLASGGGDRRELSALQAVRSAAMSDDGRFVAFQTEGRLTFNSADGAYRLPAYVCYFRDNTTRRTVELAPAEGVYLLPVISADGHIVAFSSAVSGGVWLYAHETGQVRQTIVGGRITAHAISRDGRWLAFQRNAYFDPLVPSEMAPPLEDLLAVVNLGTGELIELSRGEWGASRVQDFLFSADGTALVFSSDLPIHPRIRSSPWRSVFHFDLATRSLRLVSKGLDGWNAQGGSSAIASISANGRFVAFRSHATNLVAGDTNGHGDVFLYDTATGQTTLVSRNPQTGHPANGLSTTPALSADGRLLAFTSYASDLIENDGNHTADVFAIKPTVFSPPGDSDDDALPDAWEMAYWGHIGLNALADPDLDTRSNYEEFVADTDPSLAGSVLSIHISREPAGQVSVSWPSRPGVSYRVEQSPVADSDLFSPLGNPISGDGTQKSIPVPLEDSSGMFRVRAQR